MLVLPAYSRSSLKKDIVVIIYRTGATFGSVSIKTLDLKTFTPLAPK